MKIRAFKILASCTPQVSLTQSLQDFKRYQIEEFKSKLVVLRIQTKAQPNFRVSSTFLCKKVAVISVKPCIKDDSPFQRSVYFFLDLSIPLGLSETCSFPSVLSPAHISSHPCIVSIMGSANPAQEFACSSFSGFALTLFGQSQSLVSLLSGLVSLAVTACAARSLLLCIRTKCFYSIPLLAGNCLFLFLHSLFQEEASKFGSFPCPLVVTVCTPRGLPLCICSLVVTVCTPRGVPLLIGTKFLNVFTLLAGNCLFLEKTT